MIDTLTAHAQSLARTDKGREALRHVLAMLDGGSLDAGNQRRILALLDAAWGSYGGTALDVMREALGRADDVCA